MASESWVTSANDMVTDFPLQNLPCGVFSLGDAEPHCGVAIGEMILDVTVLETEGLLTQAAHPVFNLPCWNDFMRLGPEVWAAFRSRLTDLLRKGGDGSLRDAAALRALVLTPQSSATMHLPIVVAGYTDFYAGRNHAFNVGSMLRDPQQALPPNWLHLPIGYNGRASSVVVSGTDVRRPFGQLKPPGAEAPVFGPSSRFDFELELAAIIGQPSDGMVSVAEADAMIFGYLLLNDWSARDIQAWEYQPLGPFQAKATATSLSPWIVTRAALEPFRAPGLARELPLLPYLREPGPMLYDIALEVTLTPQDGPATTITRTNVRELYYSPAQQLCHHTTSGCPMCVGDVLGSGTISGPAKANCGSMLELSWGGKEPVALEGGAVRSFLEDGDTITLRGHVQGDGYRIGFGECTGTLLPALRVPDWAK